MPKARVLLDTNILLSGLVFNQGNEHQILRALEDRQLALVLPETVLVEAKRVLATKFSGFERVLELFLDRIECELLSLERLLPAIKDCEEKVRDRKDAPLYAVIILARPNYVVTGDKALRVDLKTSAEIIRDTKVCSSREFLDELRRG